MNPETLCPVKLQQLRIEQLVETENVRKRFDEDSLIGLKESIRESGLREPIHVIPMPGQRYMVLTGARRLRAARMAGLESIPAIVEQVELRKGDARVLQIIENVQRENLTPIERATAIDALMLETGCNASEAAAKLGLTNGTVSKLLALLSLPDELQRQIDAGELPVSAAYQLTKLDDPEAQKRLASDAAIGKLTRDAVSVAVKAKKRRPSRPRKPRPIRVTAKLENRETVSVVADSLDLDAFVSILEKLLAHAVRARADGLTLETLIERLTASRSAAKRASQTA